jgi:F-box and WD-40 domain protein CDC4
VRILVGHENRIYSIVSVRIREGNSLQGIYIYSGSMDSTIRIWDAFSGVCVQVISGFRSLVGLMDVKKVAPGLHILVAGSTDGSIQVWNATRVNLLANLPNAHNSSITCLSFNGNALVTGSEGIVRLWDLRSLINGSLNGSKNTPLKFVGSLLEQVEMVWRVAVSDRHAIIAYQSQNSTRIRVFDFMPH